MLSPTTVMSHQKGNCFEYSTLLVSLLIAAGYDAYVVSGYAVRETCYMDESRETCPLLKSKTEVIVENITHRHNLHFCSKTISRLIN